MTLAGCACVPFTSSLLPTYSLCVPYPLGQLVLNGLSPIPRYSCCHSPQKLMGCFFLIQYSSILAVLCRETTKIKCWGPFIFYSLCLKMNVDPLLCVGLKALLHKNLNITFLKNRSLGSLTAVDVLYQIGTEDCTWSVKGYTIWHKQIQHY